MLDLTAWIDQLGSTEENNPHAPLIAEAHPDAFEPVAQPPLVRDRGQDTHAAINRPVVTPVSNQDLITLSARDRATLRQLVLLRILSYAQLRRITFAGVHATVARRRIRSLASAGWLTTVELPQRHGGHERYAHPSKRAISAMLAELGAAADADAFAPLVQMMLPRSGRKPLELNADAPPKWLAHQREINHLLATMLTSSRRILWASSWDCPFPSRQAMFTLPQPDYVVIEEVDGVPRLIFGEHDRGSDKEFAERKVALYAALAQFPEACEQFFGFRSFSVQVTVVDAVRQRPIARMRELMRLTRATGLFRFALGGWLSAYGTETVWLDAAHAPISDSVRMQNHQPNPE
ncbi:MAG TPA: replication-relaxation family protein [Thermoanaerobaculia bacterium]